MTRPRSNNARSATTVVLMLLAILAIVAFQGYWLRKNYRDEQQNLHLRTNLLFRETVQKCQIEKLKLDSNFRIEVSGTAGPRVHGTYSGFYFRDSPRKRQLTEQVSSVIVSLNKTYRVAQKDSLKEKKIDDALNFKGPEMLQLRKPGEHIIRLLKGVDSTQDSVRVKDVTIRYLQTLRAENINIPFVVHRSDTAKTEEELPELAEDNTVTLGFSKPYTLELELQNTVAWVLKKLTSQILVSVLLVGLTIFSFVMLYRSLQRQRRLTQLKNDFISNITHELKTPIATVSVAIEALRNFNALHDPKRTEEYLDISAGELQRLSLLVDKVLKLSMFEKQQIELKGESFDLRQLVEEVVSSMRLQFEKYKAKVNIQLHGHDFMIRADRLHITSVVYNLLDNALKYSKANPSIQVDLASLPQSVEMSVTDNGIGISAEYQQKIFDKFFRVPTGDTHNVKGYGLGLSYVAYIVERHKGMIEVESQPGIGTRLTTKLPKTA